MHENLWQSTATGVKTVDYLHCLPPETQRTTLKQVLLFPVKIFWLSYPELCFCHCRLEPWPVLRNFSPTHKWASSTILHSIWYFWASSQERRNQSVEGLTLCGKEETKCIFRNVQLKMHKKYEVESLLVTCFGIFCLTGSILHTGWLCPVLQPPAYLAWLGSPCESEVRIKKA